MIAHHASYVQAAAHEIRWRSCVVTPSKFINALPKRTLKLRETPAFAAAEALSFGLPGMNRNRCVRTRAGQANRTSRLGVSSAAAATAAAAAVGRMYCCTMY